MTPFQEILAHAIVYGGTAVMILAACVMVACLIGYWLVRVGIIKDRPTDSRGPG